MALDSLSIHVDRGQILGFIGPNGAGKTTAIKILVGLSRPTSGSAFIAGVNCSENASKIKRLVGYMPDKFGSYDNMRVHEYLDFFGAIFGISRNGKLAYFFDTIPTLRIIDVEAAKVIIQDLPLLCTLAATALRNKIQLLR